MTSSFKRNFSLKTAIFVILESLLVSEKQHIVLSLYTIEVEKPLWSLISLCYLQVGLDSFGDRGFVWEAAAVVPLASTVNEALTLGDLFKPRSGVMGKDKTRRELARVRDESDILGEELRVGLKFGLFLEFPDDSFRKVEREETLGDRTFGDTFAECTEEAEFVKLDQENIFGDKFVDFSDEFVSLKLDKLAFANSWAEVKLLFDEFWEIWSFKPDKEDTFGDLAEFVDFSEESESVKSEEAKLLFDKFCEISFIRLDGEDVTATFVKELVTDEIWTKFVDFPEVFESVK